MKHRKCTAMLLLRLLTGGLFIYHGWPKLFAASEGMAGFVGGAFHNLGLTFLSAETWLTLLGIAEVGIGVMIVLGLFVSWVAPVLVAVMLGAMNAKGWWGDQGFNGIELDVILLVNLVIIAVGGAGRYGIETLCCKKCCGKESCKTDKSSCEANKK